MDADFSALLSSGFIPGWLAFAVVFIWYIRNKLANETITDAQWKRLQGEIKRLDERIVILETEVETCHAERDEARGEAIKWKAIAEGIGENRQEAAALLATERLAEDQRKKGGESGQ